MTATLIQSVNSINVISWWNNTYFPLNLFNALSFSKHLIVSTIISNYFSSLSFAVCLLLFKWQIRVLEPVAPARQAYSDSFIFLDRNRFTSSTNRKGGRKRNMFGKPWQRTFLGHGPSVAARELPSRVTVVFLGLHPYLTTDRIPAGCLWFGVLASRRRVSACTRQW